MNTDCENIVDDVEEWEMEEWEMDALSAGECPACGALGIEYPDCHQCGHMIGEPIPRQGGES